MTKFQVVPAIICGDETFVVKIKGFFGDRVARATKDYEGNWMYVGWDRYYEYAKFPTPGEASDWIKKTWGTQAVIINWIGD